MSHTQRCILYARKSTDREDKQILSIPAQLAELRSFAERQGLTVTEELVEHCSAREPGRPIFSKLLLDVSAGRVERILSWKLDRLARNPIDGGALIHYLGKGLLTEVVTPEGRYNGAGDSKFMLSVLFGAATKMTDDLAVGVKRGNKAIHERGRITGMPPVGYMKVRENYSFRGAGKVVPDPERFHIVKRLWAAAADGETISNIWRRACNDWGLTIRASRNKPMRPPSQEYIYGLLQNRFYMGQIVRCGEVFQGEHEPMVTKYEFDRVQEVLGRVDRAKPRTNLFTFRGLLHCGACGRLLTGEKHQREDGPLYVYYRCGRRRYDLDTCRSPGPSEQQVVNDFERSLERLTLPPDLVAWSLEAIDLWLASKGHENSADARRHREELEQLSRKLKRLTDLVVAGTLDEKEYVEQKSQALDRQAYLQRLLAEPQAAENTWRESMRSVLTESTSFLDDFRGGSPEQRHELILHLYENAIVTDRITKPVARFPYIAFAEARPDGILQKTGDVNMPPPSIILRNEKQNAHPRDERERAFNAWCTPDDSNVWPLPSEGSALSS
jgi:site-specific DNA recombinase